MTRPGVRLGIDYGDARIGVAACDGSGMLAYPLETVPRDESGADLDRIAALAAEHGAIELIVGNPLHLSGAAGQAAENALKFARLLLDRTGLPVRLMDERLTTVSADALLSGGARVRKGARRRQVIDQAAATVLLQSALDTEAATGRPAGVAVEPQP